MGTEMTSFVGDARDALALDTLAARIATPIPFPFNGLCATSAPVVSVGGDRDAPATAEVAPALDLVGLPPQLRFLEKGSFYQLYTRNTGILEPKVLSYELAGIDISEVSRRLRTQNSQLSRIPEEVAAPIRIAVKAYRSVAHAFGTQLTVAKAVFHEDSNHVFVPDGADGAWRESFLAAEEMARARVEDAKVVAIDARAAWYADMETILRGFLMASERRHRAGGHVLPPDWVDVNLDRMLRQVPTCEQIAEIAVGYRERAGRDFLEQLVAEHSRLDQDVRQAARETVLYAERLQRQDLALQAEKRRERYERAHEALLADLANPIQEMATQLRESLRESLEQVTASIDRNGGRLTKAYKERLAATVALFRERDLSGDTEIEELITPISEYLKTYRPPKKARRGRGSKGAPTTAPLPIVGPTLIGELTEKLKQKTFEEARAALLTESAAMAIDL